MKRGWVDAGVAVGLGVCGFVAWFTVHYVFLSGAGNQANNSAVAQGLAAGLTPIVALAVWLVRQVRRGVSAIDLRQAADDLAERVGRQWREAARERGLFDRPLTVRWAWSKRGLSGSAEDAVGGRRMSRIAPLPGLSRVTSAQLAQGDLSDLFAVYGGLDSGKMLLAGAPGAGKSGAMIRLLLDAVAHRKGIEDASVRATVPVPVLLTAYDWLPEHESLADWVTRRLQDEHSFLKAKVGNHSAARALLNDGLVSVLIDGVDEMPPDARIAVLRQVRDQAEYRVVLSGRTGELAHAVAGGHLDGAAALELDVIDTWQAADYLQARTVDPVPVPWRNLIRYLRNDATSALAQALDSPLMLSLLLDTYPPLGDEVDELTDSRRFPERQQIEDHLLARVLPTAYAPRPHHGALPCTAEQARQWLGYLAAQMNHTGTRDLAWWRIPKWLAPRELRLAVGLTLGLAVTLAVGLSFGFTFGPAFGLLVGPMSGLSVGIAVVTSGLAAELAAAFVFGLVFGLAVGLIVGFKAGFTVGVVVWLTVGFTRWLTRGLTSGLSTSAYDRFPPQYRGLRLRNRLPIRHVGVGLVVGFVVAVPAWLAGEVVLRPTTSAVAGLIGVLTAGLVGGLMTGVVSGLTRALNISRPTDKLITPIDSWQGNRRIVLALGLTAGIVAGSTSGVAFALTTAGIAAGAAAGIVTAVAAGLTGAATDINFVLPAYAAFVLLRRAGSGPARMMEFLEDARRRGVLRTAGPVYQFRHARLQDLLADAQSV